MTDKAKQEMTRQIEFDAKYGFETKDELIQKYSNWHEGEQDFEQGWMKEQVNTTFEKHLEESKSWTSPTDFEKLNECFVELIKQKVACLHNADNSQSGLIEYAFQIMDTLEFDYDMPFDGYCAYHAQDLMSLFEDNKKTLNLSYGTSEFSELEATEIAERIIALLKEKGFDVEWDGNNRSKIGINNFDWKKIAKAPYYNSFDLVKETLDLE